jgi:lysophospholipase L1-like esterase
MKERTFGRRLAVVSLLAGVLLTLQDGAAQTARNPRIAVFGSSVANGTGDELKKEGYTGRLRELLAARGWEVLNQSRGGDNTVSMATRWAPEGAPDPRTRYLMPVQPGFVVLGLSLGNEGIFRAQTPAAKDGVFAQFANGMRGFIDRSRQAGIVPVVTLCYTGNDFTAVEYEYTRRMNLLINSWDVPSVNFLGAVDDGHGRWADGFWNDTRHPTAAGHAELLTTFVPSLFDALERGKPRPARAGASGFARVSGGAAPLTFTPEGILHPFAIAITARAQSDGTLVTLEGQTLAATTVVAANDRKVTTLNPAAPFTAVLAVEDGVWTYRPASGVSIKSNVKADGQWHQLVLSHYTARGETLLYVDGQLAGRTSERLQTARFVIGGSGESQIKGIRQADLKDLLIYRSAVNADEVTALAKGTLLQASLDVYAPFADRQFDRGAALENRAQSLSAVKVGEGSVTHAE